MRKVKFENGYWYHIYNRGVEKRSIFLDKDDYDRFIYHLFECNDVEILQDESFKRRKDKIVGYGVSDRRKKLVSVGIWCLMPNHFHILVSQLVENGIAFLLRRVCGAYARGFNNKYQRVGPLFQGPFAAKLVNKNQYLNHLVAYILSNPLEILHSKWKENGVKNINKAKRFIDNYKYSSIQELNGQLIYPFCLTDKYALEKIIGDANHIDDLIIDIIKSFGEKTRNIDDFLLD